jgi:nucleolar protein 56
MAIYATVSMIGVLAFDDNKRLIDYKLFKGTPEEVAEKLVIYESGKKLHELEDLRKRIKNLKSSEPNLATEIVKERLRELAIDLKFVKDNVQFNKFLSQVSAAKSKQKISKLERRDKLIIQAISGINDLDKMLNVMTERLREWYGLHYPELRITDHKGFVNNVSKYGLRNNFKDFKDSMGIELDKKDIETIQIYAEELSRIYVLRDDLEKYLNEVVPEEIPNLSALLGVLLASRVLAQAGSMEKLAKLPSSTLQLLGAEKALFKFLKDKGRGKAKVPKHGLIFTHPDISSAPKEMRGKIARLLASKLTLAARADFYSKENISDKLVKDYKEKLKDIRK